MSLLVFKILKPSRTFHGIAYNEKKQGKGKARLLHFDHFGHLMDGRASINGKEAKKYLEYFSLANKRIVNKQFHAILSCKGRSMTLEQLKDHGMEIIERLGYSKNPVLIYGHDDTAHHHIHIITTRVGPDGKKIPHQFERKRSNQILSEILSIDRDQEFHQMHSVFDSYSYSTPAQYQLLWELSGYRTKRTNTDIEVFKYGSRIGKISLAEVQKSIASRKPVMQGVPKIRALIHKYKSQHSTAWVQRHSDTYTTEKKLLQTPLTQFLHQRFGLQFVFFKNPKHDTPYGYAVIDHHNKTVYKGSEVMKLDHLLLESHDSGIKMGDKQANMANEEPFLNTDPDHSQPENKAINLGLDYYIEQLERETEKEQSQAYDPRRRRRGKFI